MLLLQLRVLMDSNLHAHGDLSSLFDEVAHPFMKEMASSTTNKRHPFFASFIIGQKRTKAGRKVRIFITFLSGLLSSRVRELIIGLRGGNTSVSRLSPDSADSRGSLGDSCSSR